MKVGGPLGIVAALIVIIGTAFGAHIYPWETILWMVILIAWIILAMTWERRARR